MRCWAELSSAKAPGKLKAKDVRDLRGVIAREKAEIGVLMNQGSSAWTSPDSNQDATGC